MSKKEEDLHNPFDEHIISYTLEKDFNEVMRSQQIADFQSGLAYKSPKTAQKDLAAFDLLVSRLKTYKTGWVQANALQTIKLSQAHEYLQWEAEEMQKARKQLNDLINGCIRLIKDEIPKDKLDKLRKLEIELRKHG